MGSRKPRFHIDREDLLALVARLQQGEPGSIEEFNNLFHDKIYGHIMKRTEKDEAAAPIIFENATSEILGSINTLRKPEAFVYWCNKITEHQISAYYRAKRKREKTEKEYYQNHQVEVHETQPENRIISEYISRLPDKHAEVTRLHVLYGISVKEISKRLNIPEGTVKSRLYYGRKKLKEMREAEKRKKNIEKSSENEPC